MTSSGGSGNPSSSLNLASSSVMGGDIHGAPLMVENADHSRSSSARSVRNSVIAKRRSSGSRSASTPDRRNRATTEQQ